MRRPLIAGNWKMNLDRASAVKLAEGIAEKAAGLDGVELAVFPPAVYACCVRKALEKSPVAWGLQNVYFQANGAFTGEISVAMLQDLGCRYVILGHSERRHILGETDQEVNKKTLAALSGGVSPVVCVGEKLDQRDAGQTMAVIDQQMTGSLAGVSAEQIRNVVIAYEPVWAIGTGRNATPEQAEEVHLGLRKFLANRYNKETADVVRILYGGSVKPSNARELLAQPDIDGALVGGASLTVDQFMGIVAGVGR
jgi:triosephosphate isomerase (TIM)